MAELPELLSRWLAAGVVDATTADRIRQFEASSAPPPTRANRPSALEALLYLGLVVLSVGVFALFVQQWQDLESWARVVAIGVPTALMLATGAVLRGSDKPELQRGSQAAWLAGTGLFAGVLGVVFNEYDMGFAQSDDRGPLLVVAIATFVLAVGLWSLSPAHAQVLAIAASGFFLGQAVGNWPDDFSQQLAGMTILAIGVAALALTEVGWLTPTLSARPLFALLVLIGPFEAGVGDGHIAFEFLTGALALGIIGYGVARESFVVVLVGVAGAFVFLVTFIFEHFEERVGAPMALMMSGGILIAGVLLLEVYRRRSDRGENPR